MLDGHGPDRIDRGGSGQQRAQLPEHRRHGGPDDERDGGAGGTAH